MRINEGFENCLSMAAGVLRTGSILALLAVWVWWAALLFAAAAAFLFGMALKGGKRLYRADAEAEKSMRRADYYKSVLQGRESVYERSLFSYTQAVREKWREAYKTAERLEMKARLKEISRMKLSSLVTVVIAVWIIAVLLVPLGRGDLTAGMFMSLSASSLSMIQVISGELTQMTQKLASDREFLKDLTAFCGLEETAGALDPLETEEGFEFESLECIHVSFAYPGTDRYVLKDLNLTVKRGLHYAVVGANGAGKTTLTKLLTGLYDTYEGEIRINGKNIREYPQARLKALFALVFQDFGRYQISLRSHRPL